MSDLVRDPEDLFSHIAAKIFQWKTPCQNFPRIFVIALLMLVNACLQGLTLIFQGKESKGLQTSEIKESNKKESKWTKAGCRRAICKFCL